MYCLKVSLCCIHWSPPSHFVKTGINGKRLGAGVRPGRAGYCREGTDFFFFNNARDASRVSRKSRIFWRLQNISGPGTRRETRDSCRSHTHTHGKSERRFTFKGEREEGRRKERERERESKKEVSRGKVDKRERHQKTLFSVTKDAQWFFLQGSIDPARPLDPQID